MANYDSIFFTPKQHGMFRNAEMKQFFLALFLPFPQIETTY